jgi:hypothetical protein
VAQQSVAGSVKQEGRVGFQYLQLRNLDYWKTYNSIAVSKSPTMLHRVGHEEPMDHPFWVCGSCVSENPSTLFSENLSKSWKCSCTFSNHIAILAFVVQEPSALNDQKS